MSKMQTVLGFDFGMKTIGVAVGQTLTKTASPAGTLKAVDGVPNWQQVEDLIKKWQPDVLVVGIPLNMDGTEQPLTLNARGFVKRLKNHSTLPIETVDERLSSFEAKARVLQGKTLSNDSRNKKKLIQDINAMSAVVIVEQWLNELQSFDVPKDPL